MVYTGAPTVLAAASEFEIPPIFLKEDCPSIVSDPLKAETVPKMMCLAERVATGSRPRVLEDGPDTLNSDEDANEDIEADKELNMYAPGVDPLTGPTVISSASAARQRAIAQAVSSQMSTPRITTDSEAGNSIASSPLPSRQPTPLNSDDDDEMTVDQKRAASHGKKCAAKSIPRCPSAPGSALPKKQARVGNQGTRSRAVPEPTSPTQALKAVAPQRHQQTN
jgi:hypothetical protein